VNGLIVLSSALTAKNTNQDDSTISIIDVETNQVTNTVDVEDTPEGIDTSADGSLVYVANWGNGTVSVIDAMTEKTLDTIKAAQGSRAFGEFITTLD
jgi:YVTN family beta-propeller protein